MVWSWASRSLWATVTKLAQQDDGIELTVHANDNLNGEPSVIKASFVVGADGANSFVRQAIGAVKQDLGFPKIDNLVVDFIHNDPDREIPQMIESRSIVDPRRPTLLARWAGGLMSRCEFRVSEQEDRDFIESDEKVWSLISPLRPYPGDRVHSPQGDLHIREQHHGTVARPARFPDGRCCAYDPAVPWTGNVFRHSRRG